MKVKSLEISGFRAFSKNHSFDLDADIVLVVGVNGQGKTSFFDAILWAVTGAIPRLRALESVVSRYSTSGEARVALSIVDDEGKTIDVIRQSDGLRDDLLVKVNGDDYRDQQGQVQLIQNLWPEGLRSNDQSLALQYAIQYGVYLQQDVLTGFLTAETDEQRFNVFSQFVGAGAATEFQLALEGSRRAWSQATNVLANRLEEKEQRTELLESQLRELEGDDFLYNVNEEEWATWWTRVRSFGGTRSDTPAPDSPESQGAVDTAMAQLRTIRLSYERRRENLLDLETAVLALPSVDFDPNELELTATRLEQTLAAARESLAEAEATTSSFLRVQTEARSEHQERVLLADLALRHLEEQCPVCLQSYDKDSTRKRLEMIRDTAEPSLNVPSDLPDLSNLEGQIRELGRDASNALTALQQARRQLELRKDEQERVRLALEGLDIDASTNGDISVVIRSALEENARQLEELSSTRLQGESIALSLARAGQLARKREIEQASVEAKNDSEETRREVTARRATGDLASKMIDGIRQASSDLVEDELKKLDGLLQRIYSTADPHPVFRVARFLSQMRRGHGRMVAQIEDPAYGIKISTPDLILSSSQMNVLAVSIFLTLNLGSRNLPLNTAILDDPLQSLDDINLLGLIDLLRRIRDRRQLMVSTHDRQFAALLERKLRPVSESQRTVRVDLSDWSREGVVANQADIAWDPVPIRIAA